MKKKLLVILLSITLIFAIGAFAVACNEYEGAQDAKPAINMTVIENAFRQEGFTVVRSNQLNSLGIDSLAATAANQSFWLGYHNTDALANAAWNNAQHSIDTSDLSLARHRQGRVVWYGTSDAIALFNSARAQGGINDGNGAQQANAFDDLIAGLETAGFDVEEDYDFLNNDLFMMALEISGVNPNHLVRVGGAFRQSDGAIVAFMLINNTTNAAIIKQQLVELNNSYVPITTAIGISGNIVFEGMSPESAEVVRAIIGGTVTVSPPASGVEYLLVTDITDIVGSWELEYYVYLGNDITEWAQLIQITIFDNGTFEGLSPVLGTGNSIFVSGTIAIDNTGRITFSSSHAGADNSFNNIEHYIVYLEQTAYGFNMLWRHLDGNSYYRWKILVW